MPSVSEFLRPTSFLEVVSLAGGFIQRELGMPKDTMTVAKYRKAITAMLIEKPDPPNSVDGREQRVDSGRSGEPLKLGYKFVTVEE